jgi:ligand-binding sensor domain-containing protein/signal transduction histidine kinase
MRLKNKIKVICLLSGLICAAHVDSHAQNLSTHKVFGRYQQYIWQDQHGLPQNGFNAITRTRDGYLWLATFEGAARFDGVRFTVFDTTNTPEFKSGQVVSLLEDSRGDLWLGTNGGGLIRRSGDSFKVYTTQDGLANNFAYSLAEDHEGNLWIGTEGAGLNRLRNGRFDSFTTKDGLPDDYIHALVADPKGGVWIGTNQGLALFKDGRITPYPDGSGLTKHYIAALCLDRNGQLWVGTRGFGLSRLENGKFVDSGLSDSLNSVSALFEDREGNLWIGSEGGGLALLRNGQFSYYSLAEGLPSDHIRSIYQDPEGDMWIGTVDGGVCQLRAGRFGVYTKQDGLPHNFVMGVYEDTAGNMWTGTQGGVAKFKDGLFTTYTTKDGLPDNRVSAVAEDSAGNIWVVARGQLCRFSNNRFIVQPIENGQSFNHRISTLLGDREGNLWIGTRGSGLNVYRDGKFKLYTTADGLVDNDLLSLYQDREGAIWVGALKGGISRFKDGRFTTWSAKDGLASNPVVSFYQDHAGSLWIGTHEGGLVRFRDGKFVAVTVRDGLYDNLAFQILPDSQDDSGDLWMSCNKGIHRTSLKDLNDFADGRTKSVNSYNYGVADGMLSRECNGASPGGWKTRDGRLWFPTVKGVVFISPQQREMREPLVAIEQAVVDRTPFSAHHPVQIEPGKSSLEIRYTALSWNRPQQVRFKYQLEGLDEQWFDAGTRRTAYFSHLPPGEYTFRVIADNGEGVWNMTGQSIRIVVLPPFYRTWWFITLAVLAFSGLAFMLYKRRIAQLDQARAAQEAFSLQLITSQERERKRIAAELHDSLGQRLVIIRNWALLGAGQLARDAPAKEELDEIADTASGAIKEVREIAYNLGPYHLERLGLANTINEMVDRLAQVSNIRFTTDLMQLNGALTSEAEMSLYRITQEALNNMVKHSEATEATVALKREGNRVSLTITDDGKGFSTTSASSGFGLTGMNERVRLLKGTLDIRSTPGRGTTVEVTMGSEGQE